MFASCSTTLCNEELGVSGENMQRVCDEFALAKALLVTDASLAADLPTVKLMQLWIIMAAL